MLSPLYGQLSPLRVPTAGGPVRVLSADADANTYLLAVEAADGQELEEDVITAVETFVTGCKSDGIWSAIKASCILAGARTLNGALVPLVGSSPTNNNFVSGDYDRETGLVGNGTTKYLNSNRNNNADPQDSKHAAVYLSVFGNKSSGMYFGGDLLSTTADTSFRQVFTSQQIESNCNNLTRTSKAGRNVVGLIGVNRDNGSSYIIRGNGGSDTINQSSATPYDIDQYVFARNNNGTGDQNHNARLSFYSIGESIDLAALDSRVSTLMTDLAAAIP